MTSSLRIRLLGLWLMSLFGSIVVGVLILGLFRQTAAAHRERDSAVAGQACATIARYYHFYTADLATPAATATFNPGLRNVLLLALRRDPGIAGGIQATDPASAHARVGTIPTHLTATIAATLADASAEDRIVVQTRSTLLHRTTIAACPLGGTITDLTAYTVLRADLLRSRFTRFAFAGLAVLLATLLASAVFLARLVLGFSSRLAGIETALATDRPGPLTLTGEAELDRLIIALNAANTRLDAARTRIAQSERLAALGRMAAGLAHEIRNPLGAIRLRAESALEADHARRHAALARILTETARLETLTTSLLGFAAPQHPQPVPTNLDTLFAEAIAHYPITAPATCITWPLDPILTRSALENLLRNATEACTAADTITLTATTDATTLTITIADTGPGIDPALGDPFEPFVTGRAAGIGLGLAIARDMVQAQGGSLVLVPGEKGAWFVMTIPKAGQ